MKDEHNYASNQSKVISINDLCQMYLVFKYDHCVLLNMLYR